MKKYLLIALITLLGIQNTSAQKNFDSFYHAYKNYDGMESFELSTSLFRFFINDENREDIDELTNKVHRVNFLIGDSIDIDLTSVLKKHLPSKRYKDLMKIQDGESTIEFKALEKKGRIKEIVIAILDEESIFAMSITGDFKKSEAKSLAKSINLNKAQNKD